jgi:hypothetical protein
MISATESFGNRPAMVKDLVTYPRQLKARLAELPVVDSNEWTVSRASFSGNSTVHYEAYTSVDCDDAAMSALVAAILDLGNVVVVDITETPF